MATLTLLGSSVKRIVSYGGNLYHFTESGVDVHQMSDGVRIAYASLSNVTAGAVNDNGVYLGTSAAGVYLLTHASVTTGGDRTADLAQTYTTASTPAVQSDAVAGMDGRGTALLVTGAAGADYLPDTSTVYSYADAGGCGACAIGETDIAYAVGSGGAHLLPHPTSGWVAGDTEKVGGEVAPVLRFDGVDDYVAIPSSVGSFLADFTIETWVTIPSSGATEALLSKSDTAHTSDDSPRLWLFHVQSDRTIRFGVRLTNGGSFQGVLTSSVLLSGQKYHLGIVRSGSTITLFVDGQIEASGTMADSLGNFASNVQMGRYWNGSAGWSLPFSSSLGETRFWQTARTQQQLQDNMDADLVGTEAGLFALYRFDEGSGVTLVDSASSNDGTISGATWGSSNLKTPGTVQALAYGSDLFIGLDDKLQSHDGSDHTDHTSRLGTVKNVKSIAPTPTATATEGLLAYGTADGLGGGEFGVIDLSEI